jgi:hypothetical protein
VSLEAKESASRIFRGRFTRQSATVRAAALELNIRKMLAKGNKLINIRGL